MQKDVHFYVTYALARKAALPVGDAEVLAWADQYTDDLTEPDLHGIQTHAAMAGNWADRQVQLSVLVPFHFVPGTDAEHPWMTTAGSERALKLVRLAKGNLLQLGIALHAFQDTFSHEGFSGWREDLNSCFPWYFVEAALPNVGHAELRVVPDVVNYVWTDPRDGRRVDNKVRTMQAAKATFDLIVESFDVEVGRGLWRGLKGELTPIFKLDSYDRRIDELCVLPGDRAVDYKEVTARLTRALKAQFIEAASVHLSAALGLMRDLPWRP